MTEFKMTPEQEEILARYREKKRKETEQPNYREPRVPIEVLHEKYGGPNWGIKTTKDEKINDPEFSIEASRRLWKKEFEGYGYEAPSNPLSASMVLRKLTEQQNQDRKQDATPLPD